MKQSSFTDYYSNEFYSLNDLPRELFSDIHKKMILYRIEDLRVI